MGSNSDELSAKGQGGLRQMHSFVTLNHDDKIYTPDDDYEPDKVGEVDLGKLQAKRKRYKSTTQSEFSLIIFKYNLFKNKNELYTNKWKVKHRNH